MPPKAATTLSIKPADGLWLFTALQNIQTPVVIPIQETAKALNTKPHNVTCKISDLRKKYCLNIAGTSTGSRGGNDVRKNAGELPEVKSIKPADAEWIITALRNITIPAVIPIQETAVALKTKPHNITCKISTLRKHYGLNIAGTSKGAQAKTPPSTPAKSRVQKPTPKASNKKTISKMTPKKKAAISDAVQDQEEDADHSKSVKSEGTELGNSNINLEDATSINIWTVYSQGNTGQIKSEPMEENGESHDGDDEAGGGEVGDGDGGDSDGVVEADESVADGGEERYPQYEPITMDGYGMGYVPLSPAASTV